MEGDQKSRSWIRRKKWWLLGVGVLILIGATSGTPDWYAEEDAVMEDIARLLKAPVPYVRWGNSDWGWNPPCHVSEVYLPPVNLDEEKVRRLAELIRAFPKHETDVVCYYVWDQAEAVVQLKKELAGHASVYRGPGVWGDGRREVQELTCVAGIHRPGDLPLD